MRIQLALLAGALLASSAESAINIVRDQAVTLSVDSSNTFEVQTSALEIHLDNPYAGSSRVGSGGLWTYSNNTSIVKKVTAILMSSDGTMPQAYSPALTLKVNFNANTGSGTTVPNVLLSAIEQPVLTSIPGENISGGGSIDYTFALASDVTGDTSETRLVRYTFMDM